ncbi:MAG: sugar phosphate isomerase/epimerase [Clostridia bacterium]|nr:sugar phosphate isomerase/epimerase [Clostridia bacterium]
MKIGVSEYSFRKILKQGKNYFDVCDTAREMGYEGIDFTELHLEHGSGQQSVLDLAKALRAHCEKLQLTIVSYTIGADLLNGRGCTAEEEVQRLKGCVDVAQALGAKVMRHDAFWKLTGTRSWQKAVDSIVPAIREVTEYAAQRGIRTCSENHGFIMQDSERMVYLMEKVQHENYGWLVDIGNFLCADENPQYAVGVAAPYAVHAHVKDFLFKKGTEDMPEGSWITTRGGNYIRGTVIGHGVVPVRPCLNILKKAGYDGYVSVEFEGAEDTLEALEQGLAYLRRVSE